MSRGVGELRRSRRDVERMLSGRCATSRPVLTPSLGPGEPDERNYVEHLPDMPCLYLPGVAREIERGGVIVRTRGAVILAPHGADVNEGDLVTSVRDTAGQRVNTVNLSILGVETHGTHHVLIIEEVSGVPA